MGSAITAHPSIWLLIPAASLPCQLWRQIFHRQKLTQMVQSIGRQKAELLIFWLAKTEKTSKHDPVKYCEKIISLVLLQCCGTELSTINARHQCVYSVTEICCTHYTKSSLPATVTFDVKELQHSNEGPWRSLQQRWHKQILWCTNDTHSSINTLWLITWLVTTDHYQWPLRLARSWRPAVAKELTLQNVLESRGSSSVCRLFMSNRNMQQTTFQHIYLH